MYNIVLCSHITLTTQLNKIVNENMNCYVANRAILKNAGHVYESSSA